MKIKSAFTVAIFLSAAILSNAQVPRLINYQGKLTDTSGNPVDGSHSILFSIYNAETGGSVLWSEVQTVTVIDGLFSVLLGSVSPIPYSVFHELETYLELKFGSDPAMTPRQRLVSVGYAMHSENTDKLDGHDAADFVRSVDGVAPENGNIDFIEGSNITIERDFQDKTITISATTGGGNTLDQAYDQGGRGAGRVITADAGAFQVGGEDGVVFTGTSGAGSVPLTGEGTRMMWYPRRSAFRAGSLSATGADFWNDANIGASSVAMGRDTRATAKYSIALGYSNYAGGSSSVAMGSKTNASGTGSVALGVNTTASGYHSIAIGTDVTAGGSYSIAMGNMVSISGEGSFMIGDNSATTPLSKINSDRFYGRFANGYFLYTNSTATIGAYLGTNANSWASISDSSRKENFQPVDGESILNKIRLFKLGTWNYTGQDPQKYRHYGPMAQDFFAAFGHDGIGTIGNDTTLASADFDGINFIAIKALERRTSRLKEENERLRSKISQLENLIADLSENWQKMQEQIVVSDDCDYTSDPAVNPGRK
jgi:hypothetical protein